MPIPNFLFHGLKIFIFCQLKLFSKIWKVEDKKRYRDQLFPSFPDLFRLFSLQQLIVAGKSFPKRYNTYTFPWKWGPWGHFLWDTQFWKNLGGLRKSNLATPLWRFFGINSFYSMYFDRLWRFFQFWGPLIFL